MVQDHGMTRREALSFIRKVGLVTAASSVPWGIFSKIGADREWIQNAAAATLPYNYTVSPGQILADTSIGISGLLSHGVFSGNATWSFTEVTEDAYRKPIVNRPAKVFRLAVNTTGTVPSQYQMDFPVNVKPKDIDQVWIPSRAENIGSGSLSCQALLGETTFTNHYAWNFDCDATLGHESTWRYINKSRSGFSVGSGSPNPNNVFSRLRLRFSSTPGTSPVFYICPILINVQSKPIITIGFDDGYVEDFTNAFSYMHPRAIPGYCAIYSQNLQIPSNNIDSMMKEGWSFHNHSHSHANFGSISEQAMVNELETCRSFLMTRGMHESGESAFVYPFGAHNNLSASVVGRYYPYAFLAEQGQYANVLWDGILEPKKILRASMDVPRTSSSVIATINAIISAGNSINLYGHKVSAGAPSGNTDLSSFRDIVNHIMMLRDSNVVQVRNLQGLLKGFNAPRHERLG